MNGADGCCFTNIYLSLPLAEAYHRILAPGIVSVGNKQRQYSDDNGGTAVTNGTRSFPMSHFSAAEVIIRFVTSGAWAIFCLLSWFE